MQARTRAGRRRWVHWLPVVGAVLVLAVVAATGGFARAAAVGPRRYTVGEPVELRRWVLAVQGVELVDTEPYGEVPPRLRVHLTATWTGDATADLLEDGVVTLVVPGGPAPSPELDAKAADAYSGGFDPDVPRPVVLDAVWPDGATETSPHIPAPRSVEVVLSDERPAQNFLFADSWVTSSPLGHVDVPVADRRTR